VQRSCLYLFRKEKQWKEVAVLVTEIILMPANQQGVESAKQCAQYMARALSSIGMKVREQISLCGGRADLQKAVATALGRSNVVIVLGGLGPGQDYVTKNVLSQGLRLPLEQDGACLEAIRSYCRRTGEPFSLEDTPLSMVPKGAVVFPGQYGKTPGYVISSAKQHILMLPDNHAELAAMMPKYIAPYLNGSQAETTVTRTVRTYGIGEDAARSKLGELLDTANPTITVGTDEGEVLIRVSAHAPSAQKAAALCTPALRTIVDRIGDAAYGLDVDSLQSAVVGKLIAKELDIAVAESDTGGILTRVLAETTGGADVLRYAVSADDNAMKTEKLDVPAKLIKKKGSASEEVAVAMAAGARARASTTLGIAITVGIEKIRGKSTGLAYIAVCDANNVYVKKLVMNASDESKDYLLLDAALSRALNMTRLFVDYLPRTYSGCIPLADALNGVTITDKEPPSNGGPPTGGPAPEKGILGKLANIFIIKKTDETRIKVRKAIFIIAVIVFLCSAGYVGNYYYESYAASKQAQLLQEMFSTGDMGDVEISEDFPKSYLPQFAALWSLNPDVVGFLSIPNTPLQYPVVLRQDDRSNADAYYLRRDFYGKSNQHGVPFMDYRTDYAEPSDNMIIYGHNMKDGQIFGELINYMDLEYYRKNPVIDFSTIYKARQYKIISIFITNAYESQGPVFAYHNFVDAADNGDFLNFVQQVRVRSLIQTPVDVEAGDKLLTLSTCTYEFKDARLVVVAREVRSGEDSTVDVYNAMTNPQPLMPDIWYKTFGGTKPLGLESASVVTTPVTNTSQLPVPSSTASAAASSSAQSSRQQTQNAQQQTQSSAAQQQSSAPSGESSTASSVPAESASSQSSSSKAEEASRQSGSSVPDSIFDGLDLFDSEDAVETETDGDSRGPDDLVFAAAKPLAFANKISTVAQTQFPNLDNEPSIFDGLDLDRPGSSYIDDGDAEAGGWNLEDTPRSQVTDITVTVNGKKVTGDAQEIISRIVQNEVGQGFNEEAIKAQAVAAYSYVKFQNALGQAPAVFMSSASAVHSKVTACVEKVLGMAVYYNNKIAFTPYHATSAGQTTSSRAVWGGAYDYLVPVDSPVDKQATYYKVRRTFTSDKVAELLESKLGITPGGDPDYWFEILGYTDGGYVGDVSVCGETVSPKNGKKITGRTLRETVFALRSSCFEITYDPAGDVFHFVTYGYGHGVGMSQNGANFYAKEGWNYKQILEHYYPGATVM